MLDRFVIGKRIAKCRKKRGLTQAKFAEQLGFSEKHICCIERGNVGLTTDLLSQIAEKLEVDVLYLLADADPAKPTVHLIFKKSSRSGLLNRLSCSFRSRTT